MPWPRRSAHSLLDVHSDPDHHRSAYTLAGAPGRAGRGRGHRGRRCRGATVDLAIPGVHPHVGVVDVAPIVYLTAEDRGAACAEALVLADLLG